MAHPSFVTDAEAGDARLSKATLRDEVEFQDGLSSNYDLSVYATNASPIPLIRNEELVLIYAEANIQKNNAAEAVIALNRVRNEANLPDYSGGTATSDPINELLRQRRYALFGEGHRWVDLRRYDRLVRPIDRVGDDV